MTTLEDYFFTKNTKWILWGIAALILAALIFHAGVVVGSYNRMPDHGLAMPEGAFEAHIPFGGAVELPRGFIPGAHGALGTITTTTPTMLTITSRDGTTLRVDISSATQVSGARSVAELVVGDTIIVIGDPSGALEDGEIDARLIRVLPR